MHSCIFVPLQREIYVHIHTSVYKYIEKSRRMHRAYFRWDRGVLWVQNYWSGWPCPLPGDLPNPGIEPASLKFPALAGVFFTTSTTWEASIPLKTGGNLDTEIHREGRWCEQAHRRCPFLYFCGLWHFYNYVYYFYNNQSPPPKLGGIKR